MPKLSRKQILQDFRTRSLGLTQASLKEETDGLIRFIGLLLRRRTNHKGK